MKKSIAKISFCLAIFLLFSVMLSGCGFFGGTSGVQDDKTYTIMYSDGTKTHTIEVKNGDVYSIPIPLPAKTGYDFSGLYDAEIGGTQYVSSLGMSVAPFSDKKNIVLYPQYKAKTFNLLLNYGEATITGVTSVSVDYDADFPALPSVLTISDKPYMNFMGWFTSTNCGGTQICDIYGNSSLKMNSNLAKLSDKDQNIKIYAGFATQKYNVTFMSYDGTKVLATKQIAHGSNISTIANGITENGIIVTKWATAQNSQSSIFDGEVTRDMALYAMGFDSQILTLNRQSCKTDNGYNPNEVGRDEDAKAHSKFELVELICSGCGKNSDGKYYIPRGESVTLSLKVLQNIGSLPTGNQFGSLSWTIHYLQKDSYKGEVYGTNINGQAVGYGAYYVKVTYPDDTISESNKVNFMNGAEKNSVLDLDIPILESKSIAAIEFVCVYELYYDYWMTWSGAHQYNANWRCSTKLNFI